MKNANLGLATSRPLGVAAELVGGPLDPTKVFSKKVILTGDAESLSTKNGQWCFVDSLRLLTRVVGHLIVSLPEGLGAFALEMESLCKSVWAQHNVEFLVGWPDFRDAVAILNVGHTMRSDLPWTSINSHGWIARCSSFGPIDGSSSQENPIAALFAASLGVAEVFKRVFEVPETLIEMSPSTEFSLFELTGGSGPGPVLPPVLVFPDTLLVGGGAIGNGVTLLLSQLPLRGKLHIVDKQDFGEENRGTCCLFDSDQWSGAPKATSLATWLQLNSRLEVTGQKALIAQARSGDLVAGMCVDLVLGALDDVEARRDMQLLWPHTAIDGGINSVGAAVVTSSLDRPRSACLRCAFPPPSTDLLALQSRKSGLHRESLLGDHGRHLTEEDIERAAPEMRNWLRDHMAQGGTICSTLAAPDLKALGVSAEKGFRPSVPFVATASAALMMAQAVRSIVFVEADFPQTFQIPNLFKGPLRSVKMERPANGDCVCQRQRATVLDLASRRLRHPRGAKD